MSLTSGNARTAASTASSVTATAVTASSTSSRSATAVATAHEISSIDLEEGEEASLVLLPPPNDPDFYSWVDMLERLHRLNRLLETKEEQVIALDYEFALVSTASAETSTSDTTTASEKTSMRYVTPPPCFNLEVARFREINAQLTAEIGRNSGRLGRLEAEGRDKRRLVSQLEFDVNLVEREHKRLEADLHTVQSLVLEGFKVQLLLYFFNYTVSRHFLTLNSEEAVQNIITLCGFHFWSLRW